MFDVFISYAHSDSGEAERLVKALRATNVAGWLDAADISGGEGVPSAVRDALKRSSAVVVLLSPHALNSRWVQFDRRGRGAGQEDHSSYCFRGATRLD